MKKDMHVDQCRCVETDVQNDAVRWGGRGGWGLEALSPVISDAKHQDKDSVKNWDNLGSAGKSAKVSLSLA